MRKYIRHAITAAAVCLFLFSSFKIASYYYDQYRSKQAHQELRALYEQSLARSGDTAQESIMNPPARLETVQAAVYSPQHEAPSSPSPDPELPVQDAFQPLLEINEDIVGWLSIKGTTVDYPVVQAADNDYYLYRDIYKKDNVNGSIFMDYRNRLDGTDRHLVVYGHNMKNRTMFAGLLHYESQWYFDQNTIVEFNILHENSQWEIFSVYFTDVHHDYIQTEFPTTVEWMSFLEDVQERSLHHREVELNEHDVILTLSTCSPVNDDARFAVHARLIK